MKSKINVKKCTVQKHQLRCCSVGVSNDPPLPWGHVAALFECEGHGLPLPLLPNDRLNSRRRLWDLPCNNASNKTVCSYCILSLLYNFHLSLLGLCQPVTHWQVRSRHLICVKYTKLVQVATQIRGKTYYKCISFYNFPAKAPSRRHNRCINPDQTDLNDSIIVSAR